MVFPDDQPDGTLLEVETPEGTIVYRYDEEYNVWRIVRKGYPEPPELIITSDVKTTEGRPEMPPDYNPTRSCGG